MNPYQNKKVLITGGSSGIGLALARQLACQDASVFVLARKPEILQRALETMESCRVSSDQKFGTIQSDVTSIADLEAALAPFTDPAAAPDVLINAAGVAYPGEFVELESSIFHWMMDVNYFGTVNTIKLLLPQMLQRRSGQIINFSSIAGFLGVYGYTAYGASKYAVRGFSDALRAELKPRGITVSVVFPPDTDTPQLAYEDQFKPAITRQLSSSAHVMSADQVAAVTLQQAAKAKYIITPGMESTLFFKLANILGKGIYWVMDLQIAQAQKKIR